MTNQTNPPPYHVFQGPHSNICGPACLAMVYGMRGRDITLDDVLRDFHHDRDGKPTYAPQLATHLAEHGMKTKFYVSSSKIFSPAWKGLSKDKLIENLKLWLAFHSKDEWHMNNMHVLFYLQAGGEAVIESYTAESLKRLLDKGSTLILCIDEDWVWGHRLDRSDKEVKIDEITGGLEGHFVVVTGYAGDQFHVVDPYPTNIEGRHGSYDIDAAALVNASLTWDAEVIEIEK